MDNININSVLVVLLTAAKRIVGQLVLLVLVWAMVLYYWHLADDTPAVISDRWDHRVVALKDTCYASSTLVITSDIVAWCHANGADEVVIVNR